MTNYKETIDWLFAQLPMFHRQGSSALKLNLENTLAICERLGNPHQKIKTIHVGGTNGKGTTAHLIAAALQQAGYKTGLYVSPHYRDFRERIKIDGKYIPQKTVTQFVEKHKCFFEEIQPSFFEMTVGLAFDYFAQQKVDVAVIEVGLGGRLDSTNVIEPILSVITNISYDHTQFLGDTLPKIAGEKAGIIKKNTPVVIGEHDDATANVFIEKAKEMNAPIIFASKNYQIELKSADLTCLGFDLSKQNKLDAANVVAGIAGSFQIKNIVTARQAIDWINQSNHFQIHESDWRIAFENVRSLTNFIGRWQVIQQRPTILCDSGHNLAGFEAILEGLKAFSFPKTHFILGFVNDKDIRKILKLLPKNDAQYYFTNANMPRAMPAVDLQAYAKEVGIEGKTYSSVKQALASVKRKANSSDLIFVGGSIFVVGEII